MYHKVHERESRALSTAFFTKEFAGFEVESKWQLLTENPVPTILRFMADIHSGKWEHIQVAKSMGKLPVGLRYFELHFDFWATPDNTSTIHYRQVAMVAVLPGANLHQVAFKESDSARLLFDGKGLSNPPLVRREGRKGDWIRESDSIARILKHLPNAEKVATMIRQKCYAYVHDVKSYRNFSISADLCRSRSKTLSQVEIEYKGRNGVWLPDTVGYQIAQDFLHIHEILSERYGNILVPTTQTKFQWIMGG
jgi:hypothetical protein